ncbi:hypothetical protein [Salinivibrio sp. SS2]|uniref:hypothetical protein n=1 Tax=Salinivibrio sp. SS2 TaxID=1892894 RepID=UPI00084CC310|nr:hypothetical protein [Salinivibrio sp. DV]ODQ00615.1 hypothetical protein BGK46_06080 [Salinivibrio sp. DV]
MIIRLKNRAQGILEYLVFGSALSGGEHRNSYDERIKVSGDWTTTKATLDWLGKNKSWSNNYTHITLSFSPIEAAKIADVSTEERDTMLADIVQMAIKHFAPHRADEDLLHYAEYHDPIKKFDSEGKERLPHIHLVLPRLDMKTGNQLRIIPKDDQWMAAIQSKINSKYPELLTDPAWTVIVNAENNIKRKDPSKKKLNTRASEKLASYLFEKKPKSGAELCKLLNGYGGIEPNSKIKFTATKNRETEQTKNIYISIKGVYNGKPVGNINLTGENFEFLRPLYDQYRTLSDNPEEHEALREAFKTDFQHDQKQVIGLLGGSKIEKHQQKLRHKAEKESLGRGAIASSAWLRDKLIQERFNNWIKHDKPNKVSIREVLERQERYDEFNDKLEQDINSFSSGQRSFYVMYQSNIQHRFVAEGVFYKDSKTDKITYSDKQHKFRLVDHGAKITASTTEQTDLRVVARLMIEQGIAKGWDLDTIQFWGSDEWVKIANEELEWRKNRDVPEPIPTFDSVVSLKGKEKEYPTQRVEESLKKEANNKGDKICQSINSSFTMASIELTANRLGLDLSGQKISIDGKRIKDIASGKHFSAIDFFTKRHKKPISEVAPVFYQAITDTKLVERNTANEYFDPASNTNRPEDHTQEATRSEPRLENSVTDEAKNKPNAVTEKARHQLKAPK